MKKFFLLVLLSSAASAQTEGFSPTMPFGIPDSAYRSQDAVNSAGPCDIPCGNHQGFSSYYYYYGGGGGMASPGTNRSTGYGATLPTYSQEPPKGLDSYNRSPRRKKDTLPGY